ncbi:hypothetical protein VOLCADRAFT_120493 [Volvox carteri f. nagariensis]|uniref:Transcription factor 25 n=1 Tax=Volvox carteri f. nagariensis TaxID=3068 RepID=D8TMF7_VOLCA|nr:uncharacterized protein VOLCADRAFT_120493 [Volvox carteri f. nagariensis]EFJ51246.1 hypothetical protein VOLCADRAFT_120493 [Volvox carteri f. nagariensis]|eukprot:XP_002947713.1 hypothetical protein VOLCADRAFT_120493 [Volvox carteri f. nagariensis]
MATRHLRRIQEQASKHSSQEAKLGELEEEDDVVPVETKKVPFNPFDLLSDEEDHGGGSDPDDRSGGAAEGGETEPTAGGDTGAAKQRQQEAKAKPKVASKPKAVAKKQKKGGKGNKHADTEGGDSPKPPKGKSTAVAGNLEEDIEAIVRELNLATGLPSAAAAAGREACSSSAASASPPRAFGATAAGARLLGQPSVLCVDVKGLRGDEEASYDPATIAALLQQAPYHVDSLLAMHDLYRHMGENSYAEEMLERALWMLESAWHPSFQPATASCRLDYSVEENRALFGALFRHVQALSRRGCHRAALECCKLLLVLEPEDPLGALCLIDYLAVRAGRYDWLQRFVLQFEGNRSLALLPNYTFALPMAAHRAEQQQGQGQQPGSSSAAAERAQPGASSSSSNNSNGTSTTAAGASPHELLVGALLLHPLVLPRLVAKLQDKGAAKEPHWKELLSRRLFSGASDGGSTSLSHLVGLYVERSGELWKPPDLLALLRRAAEEAADVADGKVAPANGISAADWRTLARESFPSSASNEYRHLRLADFSDAVNALPREEVEAAVQGGGAMQDVEEALAELQEQMILAAQQRPQQANGGGGPPAMTDEQLRGANPLLLLLRSLLPWVNAGQQPDYAAEDAAAAPAGAPAGGAAVRQQQPQQQLEYDEDDGHLDDEEGVVRQVRR